MVSIHAFRGEGDLLRAKDFRRIQTFQSTPSGGKATFDVVKRHVESVVSIHAFRGEGDIARYQSRRCSSVSIHAFRGEGDWRRAGNETISPRVSIHAFRGEGDIRAGICGSTRLLFQSTPSGGKATEVSDAHVYSS